DAGEEFKTPTEANNNALQYGIEQEKARIKALEAEKAKAKETKVIDNNELLKIVSDNDNNLDKITTETSGDTGVKTTFENKRDKPKKADDTTPVPTTDIHSGGSVTSKEVEKDETPSAVMSFLGDAGSMALKGTGAAIYGAGKVGNEWLQELDFSDGLHGGGGTSGDMSQGYVPENLQSVQSLEQALPSVESISPAGVQPIDDGQFVDTMDGQLSNQGYMGPSLDNVVGTQEGPQTMALDGAPQYNIQDLQTGGGATPVDTVSLDRQMSGADGSSLDSRMSGLPVPGMEGMMQTPEEVIAGGQGGGVQTPVDPQQLAQLGNEVSLGDIQGMLGGVGDTLTSMADGVGEKAYESVEKAVQNIEKVLAETGLIDDPQAIEAVNDFVEKVDDLVKETKGEIDTPKTPEEEKSFWDTITDFLGDLMTQFTEITGITSQDLMRALIMYAGSRLLGYSGHDSVQFAYGDFEKNIARRFEENKESREFLANSNNLNDALDGLYAEREKVAAAGADTSSLDRRIKSIEEESNSLSGGKKTSAAKNLELFEEKKEVLNTQRASEIAAAEAQGLPDEDEEAAIAAINDRYDTEEGLLAKSLLKAVNFHGKGKHETLKHANEIDEVNAKATNKYIEELVDAEAMAHDSKGDIDHFLNISDETYTGSYAGVFALFSKLAASSGVMDAFDLSANYETLKKLSHNFVERRMQMTKGSITEREMKLFADASPSMWDTEDGLHLLLTGMAYNDQYVMDHAEHMAGWVIKFKEDNEDRSPSTSDILVENRRYKKENKFELPFTNQDIKKAQTSRRFKFDKDMTRDEEYQSAYDNRDNAKTKDEMDLVVEAAKFLGHY
nr:hypothetical protein [Gammaproteobacteria bacterium]